MIKAKIGVSPPRQSPKKKPSRDTASEKIQLKITEYESQLQKIRDDIFTLQVELFQITSPTRKAIIKPILQNIEKTNHEYELTRKKYDLSQNLVQIFQSIIDIYPIDQNIFRKSKLNKPLSAASSNVVKPHIKNYVDYSRITPFERAQKTQRVGDSRTQLKKKIEIYQSHQLLKSYMPAEEKEIRTKRDFITLLEKDLVDLKKANDHLIRRFGTNSGFRVSSQIKYGQKINKTLKDSLHDFQKEFGDLSNQIRLYQSQIDSLQDPPHYARIIDEGKKYKEFTNQRVNDLLQEASDRVKFGQKILASIERIASLLDPNHLSSGIAITELQWIMQKLSKIFNKSITCSPSKTYDSIWDLTKTSTLKIFDDENNSSLMNTNDNGESFPEIPEIPIMTMFPKDQSLGNTRQTRRLFSALNSLRSGNDNDKNINQSLDTLGIFLGNVFVDRFSPLFHYYDTKLSIAKPDTVFLPKPLTKTVDLTSLLNLYIKYKNDINMTQLQNEEIQNFDPDFLSFSTEKSFFKENLTFSKDEFVDFIINSINSSIKTPKTEKFTTPKKTSHIHGRPHNNNNNNNYNFIENSLIVPCLWMAHDFATEEEIPYLIQKLTPIFNKNRKSFVISNPADIVAWAAIIASFFRCHSRPIKEALCSLFDPIFPILLDKFLPTINDNVQTRCTTLALLRYGKHFPREFMNFINLKNNATSFLHNFIQLNYKMPTFVRAAIDFAKSSLFLLKEESLTWHTSLFYHYLVNELMHAHIRIKIVESFLSILCSIVENRDSSMTLLLKRIYFIYFLKKNFELEEIVCERQDDPQNVIQNVKLSENFDTTKSNIGENNNSNPSMLDSNYSYKYDEEEEEEEFGKSDFEPNLNEKKDDEEEKMPFVPPIALNFSSISMGSRKGNSSIFSMNSNKSLTLNNSSGSNKHANKLNLNSNENSNSTDNKESGNVPNISLKSTANSKDNEYSNENSYNINSNENNNNTDSNENNNNTDSNENSNNINSNENNKDNTDSNENSNNINSNENNNNTDSNENSNNINSNENSNENNNNTDSNENSNNINSNENSNENNNNTDSNENSNNIDSNENSNNIDSNENNKDNTDSNENSNVSNIDLNSNENSRDSVNSNENSNIDTNSNENNNVPNINFNSNVPSINLSILSSNKSINVPSINLHSSSIIKNSNKPITNTNGNENSNDYDKSSSSNLKLCSNEDSSCILSTHDSISASNIKLNSHEVISSILNTNGNANISTNEDMKLPFVPQISFAKLGESRDSTSGSSTKINISYNDLSNVSPIDLNLDNPKLQLHFQKDDNQAPIRSSVSFSNTDYMSQRSMYPIYLDTDVHELFVKTMFATLVDHSLNRFDVFFCDPFPFVNRKPNILFTLMQHMESSANVELKDILFDHSNNQIEETASEDIPPIPPINVHTLNSYQKKEKSENDTVEEFVEPQIKRSLLPPVSPNKNISLNKIPFKIGISAPKLFDQNSLLFDSKGINNNNVGEFLSFDNLVPEGIVSRNEYKYLHLIRKKKAQANIIIAKRLMRLTMPCLFNKDNYLNGRHIASGAFGSVMVVRQAETNKLLAVKILKKSKNEYDNPHLFEVFTEVSILEMCQKDRRVTQLTDYGCTSNSYYIIMEYYPTTLKAWRRKNTEPEINVLLRLYREFLNSCTVLHDKHINHYDIKCDNVMVDDTGHPCLADFGESMCYTTDKNCFTMLNKGTEWIKSPEMLSIALNSTITNPNFDRRKKVGAGPESDVWSIGCLFYELITGEFLFAETNWSHFFRRITESDQVLILPENKEKLPNDNRFGAFLEFVLQRNFRSRPNLHQVISKFDEFFPEALNSPLPKIEMPTFE